MEFAISAVLLFSLLFGVIEFGLLYNSLIELRSTAREGGRLAVVDNGCAYSACTTTADQQRDSLIQSIQGKLAGTARPANVSISVYTPSGKTVGSDVIICLNYTYTSMTGLFQPFLNNKILRAKADMRLEQPATFTSGSTATDIAGTLNAGGPVPSC